MLICLTKQIDDLYSQTPRKYQFIYTYTTMAHKKAAGSAKNLRDSNAKYRWVKKFGGQPVVAGNIIIRQKGDKYALGANTYKGKDFSIHATIDGIVAFSKKNVLRFDGRRYLKTVVEVTTEVTTTEVTVSA